MSYDYKYRIIKKAIAFNDQTNEFLFTFIPQYRDLNVTTVDHWLPLTEVECSEQAAQTLVIKHKNEIKVKKHPIKIIYED